MASNEKEVTIKVDESVLYALDTAISAIAEMAENMENVRDLDAEYISHIADLRFMEDWLGNFATTIEAALEETPTAT